MIAEIVDFLRTATSSVMSMTIFLFSRTRTWSLVFAGISIVLISRFILGPVLGFTASGASDMVKSRRRSKE